MYPILHGAHSCFIRSDYTGGNTYNCRDPPQWEAQIAQTDGSILLSIIIPALNEAGRLPRTLESLNRYLRAQPYRWEIIVVSNGSTDATDEVVRAAASWLPNLRLISLPGRGKGLAVREGALASAGEIVFICDADLSMPPETLERFLEAASAADIVVGSREAHGARRFSEPRYRHVMGRVFNRLVQLVAVPGIRDTQCGFKAFRRDAAVNLMARQTLMGWSFDVELLYLARKYGYHAKELGIDWHFDADTRVRPGIDTLSMLGELVLIRLRDLRGAYDRAALSAAEGDRA
jgi:dolichyl-phosphate beta-glucosyltransferase